MAITIDTIPRMQLTADTLRREGKRIAVVPTMGALHDGHLSLIRLARRHGDVVVTTVFVNPTQFGPAEDFARYPRDLARDAALASEAGSSYVFAPSVPEMYPPEYRTFVSVEGLTERLEGRSRPGHFRGVATVVTKLFLAVKPHSAVFGQKDAQQVAVIRRMVADLNFHVDIIVAPTVREPDGLALSSRNVYLTPEQRAEAPVLYRALTRGESMLREGEVSSETVIAAMRSIIAGGSSAAVDYISLADAGTLQDIEIVRPGMEILLSLAARFGATRLIDNIQMRIA